MTSTRVRIQRLFTTPRFSIDFRYLSRLQKAEVRLDLNYLQRVRRLARLYPDVEDGETTRPYRRAKGRCIVLTGPALNARKRAVDIDGGENGEVARKYSRRGIHRRTARTTLSMCSSQLVGNDATLTPQTSSNL